MHFFGTATYAATISDPIDKYRFNCLPSDRKGALMIVVIGIAGTAASAVQISWLEYVLAGCAIAALLQALRGHAKSAADLRSALQLSRCASTTQPGDGNAVTRQETRTGWPPG